MKTLPLFYPCLSVGIALVLSGFQPLLAQEAPAEQAPARRERGAPNMTPRAALQAEHGIVTSAQVLASKAGLEILQKGGNAVDAAIATGFGLEVVYGGAGNIGGGGFMMIHLADGRNVAINYREMAPAMASRNMYVDKNGEEIKGEGSALVGWHASGVPGTVAGFGLAFAKYGSGKVTWADVIEPARRLAADGWTLSAGNARALNGNKNLAKYAESNRVYRQGAAASATPWKEGDVFKQPDLAATFVRLQKEGWKEFYQGETARRIDAAERANGGTIRLADLKNYKAQELTPLHGNYRGYDIYSMPPPSSGGVALLQLLKMVEPYNVEKMGPNSPEKYELFIEAMKRAFRDRAEYMGDPDFVKVPVAGMLDPNYIKGLMANYNPDKATPAASIQPGKPAGWELVPKTPQENKHEGNETTHYSVVDAAGNAVANTYTLNFGYGSGVTIAGTGIVMNDEMDDFAPIPGKANGFGLIQGEADAVAPGKRPLSAMTPTLVLKDGQLWFVTGSPGGPTIINTVFEIVTNVIDHHMSMMAAVAAPRFHNQWMPDQTTFERNGISSETQKKLTDMGEVIKVQASQGDGESIMIDPASHLRLGASDPRSQQAGAVGY